MSEHENKCCPRCGIAFECRAGDVTKCRCFAVQLNDGERDFLLSRFSDCLCAACLTAAKAAAHQSAGAAQLKKIYASV